MNNENIIRNIINNDEDFIWHVTGSIADVQYNPVYWILTVLTLGIFLIALKLKRIYRSYILTNQRLIIITGILSKTVDEIELFRIVNSSTTQSMIDVMANLGTISIDSTDMTGSICMYKIPNPHMVRDALRKQYTIARQKKGTVVLESLSGQA
ncbi:MAG: PH domain-containing protein [Alphaproteobacteria bacterium]|nr:PH domain-containing protein [Alphaproteobacteria bacterium]